jgi:excinuclease UvrABC nuclease subunit
MLLKSIKITPFQDLFWKIRLQQQKEMISMHTKIPRSKKSGHLHLVFPLIPQKTTKMEEEKGKCIAFDLKTRVGQPSDATKYKKYVRKFQEGNPQEWINNLEEIWTQNSMAGGTDRASIMRALLRQLSKMQRQQKSFRQVQSV